MNNRSFDNLPSIKGVPWMAVYICEAVLILTGNSITVYIFWSIRNRLKRTSYLLINLAVADFLVGISITIFIWDGIAVMKEIELTYVVLNIAEVTGVISTISSLLSIVLISLERMFAILWPFRHRILNIWCYHISVGIIWFVACLYAIVNITFKSHNTTNDCTYDCFVPITIISSVLFISGAYLAIWISTRRNRMIRCRSLEQDRKLAKTLFLVTGLSIITYLPSGVIFTFGSNLYQFYSFKVQITIAVQKANSFFNPIVYCFRMPEFKESLNKILCRCSPRQQHPGNNSGVTLRSFKMSVEAL